MKKLILLVVILSTSLYTSAQFSRAEGFGHVKQSFGIEYLNVNHYRLKNKYTLDKMQVERGDFSFRYKMELNYNKFTLNSDIDIYMDKSRGLSFDPVNASFTISLSYTYRKIKLSISHRCLHPIEGDRGNHEIELQGGFTKVGIYYKW
ncbi:MAG: hypothetical protein M0P15_04315 [Bacteroides sp.]|nr:hypothetical protein [Bacteroides sp.]